MKTLTTVLQQQKEQGTKLFIPYIMAGANGLERLPAEIEMLVESGASAIELGIPFSDPVADGLIIQQAAIQARQQGVTFKKIIAVLQQITVDVPIILMGYANSFFHYGIEQLVVDLATTDVKGVIIPDLPYEHRDLFLEPAQQADLAFIQLVTLTSSPERIAELLADAQGFIYAVTIKGTTGTGQTYEATLDQHLALITEQSQIPVLAGFGVSQAAHVQRFHQCCDGVVIGSSIVQSLSEQGLAVTQNKIREIFR